jgi:DUF2924 family protein
MPSSTDEVFDIDRDLAWLSRATIRQLRQRWRSLFGTEPPPAFGPDLLRRSIAQQLQENAYGKLSVTAQRQLDRIIALLRNTPSGQLVLPRRIKAGAVLIRDWKTQTHRVTVLDDGFEYDGHNYASLSEIAREITGTNWNGPRFFGLRANPKKSTKKLASENPIGQASASTINSPKALEASYGM